MTTRADAESRDAADPLARWRDEFIVPDHDLVYLDGNSLGRTPKRTLDALRRVVEREWAGDLITSWWDNEWLDLPLTVGDELAPLLGARPGEVAVHDSTTVCLFQLVNVAIDLCRTRRRGDSTRDSRRDSGRDVTRDSAPVVVAVEAGEFPTDRYVVDGIARLRGGFDVPRVRVQTGIDDLEAVDVVVRSHVDYRTAAVSSLEDETARATAAGAVTVWDLSHAAGVLELDLDGAGVEFAAGCTYKFLNGGPGAPAFTYVRRELHADVVQPIWGWFGQRDQFAMDNPFDARDGIGRLLNGTPGILGLTAARAGISLTAEAGIVAIAEKAAALAHFAIDLADERGLTCSTARPPLSSGGHVSIVHPDAVALQAALAADGIIVDKRDPDVLRVGLSPLTTRYTDVHDALIRLSTLVG